jgi:hypothetical protein
VTRSKKEIFQQTEQPTERKNKRESLSLAKYCFRG